MGYGGHTPRVNPETKKRLEALSEELLPCPICGNKVQITVGRDLEGDDTFDIACCICFVYDYPDGPDEVEQEVRLRDRLMRWWNDRKK